MKYLIPLLFIASVAYGQSPCFPSFNFNYDYINHFEYNSLFNIQSGENGDYTIYSIDDFTTSVSMGETYSMQVASEYSTLINNRFTAWIDFDNDGVFASDEVVLDAGGTGVKYKNEMITIPFDASYIGIRRLRVMMAQSTVTLNPCGSYYCGEAEDYFITITDSYVEPCYCTPFIRYSHGAKIEDFNVEDILNCNSEYDPFSYYSFYPDSIFTTDLAIGETYRMLVSKGTNAGPSVGVRVNVDFDNNHVFESDECILVSSHPGPGIVDKYLTVPNDSSIIGQHRMRVRISYGTPSSGCPWSSGETEDYIINIISQDTNEIIPDWQKVINLPFNQRVYDISETYDSGFAISLAEGSNMSKFRLIKLSIDGDTLWTKFPTSDDLNYPHKMYETHDGGFIICGCTDENDPYGEPYALKLDACGGLQWKNTYGNIYNYDYASHIIQSSDSNYIVLNKYLSETSRIALFKLDSIGNVIWQNDYTHHFGSEPKDLFETLDKGYLITGFTYTPNPGDSSIVWLRSMLIKVDNNGNEQWEKVLGISDTTISLAFSSVELETGGYLVLTTIVDLETNARSLGVYRVDESGNLLFYKTVSGISDLNKYGKFIRKMDGNNYCIVSGIYNGCYGSTSMLGLYMIDSDANVLDSAFVNDYYLDIQGAVVTENNKLVVSGSKDFPDYSDIFMFKFNEDLEFDTLYNMYLNYDWICDIIIYQPELPEENIKIDLYPNPACNGINIQINESNEFKYYVEIISMNGSVLKREYIHSNELKYFSLEDLNSGMYIITISHNNRILSSRKIIKSR